MHIRAIGIGIGVSLLLTAVMLPLVKTGISPLPQPLGAAFANMLLGNVPIVIGILFHVVYVTFWSYIYVLFFIPPNTFLRAATLAFVLWLITLFIFLPAVGWGVAGLSLGMPAIVATFVSHTLFAVFLWLSARFAASRPGDSIDPVKFAEQ